MVGEHIWLASTLIAWPERVCELFMNNILYFYMNYLRLVSGNTAQLSSLRICNTVTSDCRYNSDVCFVCSATGINMAFIIISELRS